MTKRTTKRCSVDGCEKPVHARGWCDMHYRRWRRTGDPEHQRIVHEICAVEGCKNPHEARGYCNLHYRRWKNHGTTDKPIKPQKFCAFEGCHKPYYAKNFCSTHYKRLQVHGTVTPRMTYYRDPEESFKARTEWQGDCLVWTGHKDQNGYGRTTHGDKSVFIHRWLWQHERGPIPDGMEVDHQCHNPACVNINHLRLATRSQNQRNQSGPNRSNKSGHRNVIRSGDKWHVIVTKNRRRISFGYYDDLDEAAKVAEQARRDLFGEFAGKG